MWVCRGCGTKWEFKQLSYDVDGKGCFFVCPGCFHRNALHAHRETDGTLTLTQSDADVATAAVSTTGEAGQT